MSTPLKYIFNALPPYFGGKRRLLPWIFKALAGHIPKSDWDKYTFLEAFTGAGSVSLYAKALGFKEIYVNDWSDRSQIVIDGLLCNQSKILTRQDLLWLTQPLPKGVESRIQKAWSPTVFSSRHVEALDRIWYWSQQKQDVVKRNLGLLLLWHLTVQSVCMGTSINKGNRPYAETLDGLRDWQDLPAKRFADGSFTKLLLSRWSPLTRLQHRINKGVFGGVPVRGHQLDATEFVSAVQGDILYLDPPYPGTLSYETSLKTLDDVLMGPHARTDVPKSPFTQDVKSLCPLLDAAQHIPVWILSYGNHAIDIDGLVDLVRSVAPKRHVQGYVRTYRHMSHVSQRTANEELLVIATD